MSPISAEAERLNHARRPRIRRTIDKDELDDGRGRRREKPTR